MRFSFWTAGDRTIGIGHLTRSAAVAAELVGRGHEVSISARVAEDLLGYATVPGASTRVVEPGVPSLPGGGGVVITDLPGLGPTDVEALGAARHVHLASDGLDRVRADLAIVDDLALGPATVAAARVVVGIEHHVVRPEVLALRPERPWAGDRVRRVLIALGGADPGALTEPLVAALAARDPRLAVLAVAGPAWTDERSAALVRARGRDGVLIAPPDLATPILDADVVVTLGGRTTFEAFALGRPALCLAWSHMADYVAQLARASMVHDVGPDPEIAADRIVELSRFPDALVRTAAVSFATVDDQAAARVADLCESVHP